jgi:peptidoglycan/LPS O-acetylase OafA/YrhL
VSALLFRTRVAVLWVAVAIGMSTSLLLYLFVPGALEQMVAGEMEGEALDDAMGFFFMTLGAIPLVMAGVALLVSDRVNRYVNLIAGLAFGLFGVFAVVSHLMAGDFNGHVLMVGLAGALAFLIAGLSLAGLRQPTSSAAARGSEPRRTREEVGV